MFLLLFQLRNPVGESEENTCYVESDKPKSLAIASTIYNKISELLAKEPFEEQDRAKVLELNDKFIRLKLQTEINLNAYDPKITIGELRENIDQLRKAYNDAIDANKEEIKIRHNRLQILRNKLYGNALDLIVAGGESKYYKKYLKYKAKYYKLKNN